MKTTKEDTEDFLTWVMANRDVHSRTWTDEIEPILLEKLEALISKEVTEALEKRDKTAYLSAAVSLLGDDERKFIECFDDYKQYDQLQATLMEEES